MTVEQIKETVSAFAEGARRAREAGLDGVELHGANGYLITQFLSSAITIAETNTAARLPIALASFARLSAPPRKGRRTFTFR